MKSRFPSALIQSRPTELGNNDPEEDESDNDAEGDDLAVLPPHLPADGACAAAEGGRLGGHGVGLVDEELDALAAAEDLLDVLDHNVLDVVKLLLRTRDLVRRRGGVVRVHQGGNHGREGAL